MRVKRRKRVWLWVAAATAAVCGACFAACGEKGAGQSGSSVQSGQSDQAEEVYTVTFIADGVVVGTDTYTAEDAEITAPAVPEKKGYTGEWEAYSPDNSDITVHAVYTPLLYELTVGTRGDPGVAKGEGTYPCGGAVTVCAEPYAGYAFAGWYEGDIRRSTDVEYTFEMPPYATRYEARFVVREDMKPFSFTSHRDFCMITGVEDRTLTSVVIPDCVTSIGDGAFRHCSYLTNVRLPDGLTYIGTGAFLSCFRMTDIEIPESVTYIGDFAFQQCHGLTDIKIPKNVQYIGECAFTGCYGLTSAVIGSGVTGIGAGAFDLCEKLERVYYGGTAEEWAEVSIDPDYNDPLLAAEIYHYSETQPTGEGKYWHYDENGEPVDW